MPVYFNNNKNFVNYVYFNYGFLIIPAYFNCAKVFE